MRFDALVPVDAVACGRGSGVAVCPALGLLFTSNYTDNTLSAFALAAPGFPALGTWGRKGSGPLEFDFGGGAGFSGMMCFTGDGAGGGGDGPFLLVTDHGNDRVVELEVGGVGAGRPPVQRCTFGGGAGAAPRGVAACGALIAVLGWKA